MCLVYAEFVCDVNMTIIHKSKVHLAVKKNKQIKNETKKKVPLLQSISYFSTWLPLTFRRLT